jgi:hypothetical protein
MARQAPVKTNKPPRVHSARRLKRFGGEREDPAEVTYEQARIGSETGFSTYVDNYKQAVFQADGANQR